MSYERHHGVMAPREPETELGVSPEAPTHLVDSTGSSLSPFPI
ncbi:MAG: hypothetical protein ACE5R6_19195 [Candidatus Heimdallarchaeota archaeon]